MLFVDWREPLSEGDAGGRHVNLKLHLEILLI